MPRRPRQSMGGIVYHVLNRGVGQMDLFDKLADYDAFERVIERTYELLPTRILSFCLMSNHWHMVLWPRADGELSEFMRLLTVTHTQRWHAHRHTAGSGPVYQGRFKSFPVQHDAHFLTVMRYVERNALRANRVERAEDWRWSSLWHRLHPAAECSLQGLLSNWPVDRPRNWRARVNQPETEAELKALRQCVQRGSPFGSDRWVNRTATRLGLESTLRDRGRPKKKKKK